MRAILLGSQYRKAQSLIPPDAIVIDLGANIGASLRLWQESCPRGCIVAVEPDADNVAMIRRNLVADYEGNVSVVVAGAAGVSGTAVIDSNAEAWRYRVQEKPSEADGRKTIELLTVPELLAREGLAEQPIDLLKCDIEGSEEGLLAAPDARNWLRLVRLLAIEVHAPYTVDRLEADLDRHGCDFEILELVEKGPMSEAVLRLRVRDQDSERRDGQAQV